MHDAQNPNIAAFNFIDNDVVPSDEASGAWTQILVTGTPNFGMFGNQVETSGDFVD